MGKKSKRERTGGTASNNSSDPDDPLERMGRCADMDTCHDFAHALMIRMLGGTSAKCRVNCEMPTALFDALQDVKPAEGKRTACMLNLSMLGHHCVLELARDEAGALCGRVFSSWIVNKGGYPYDRREPRIICAPRDAGYTGRAWAEAGRCTWMGEVALHRFCDRLAALRQAVERLAATELRRCAIQGTGARNDAAAWRDWATKRLDKIEALGLTVVPPNPIDCDDFKQHAAAMGGADVDVMQVVQLQPDGGAEHLLDFPISAAAPIADLTLELFAECPPSFAWLKMVENLGHDMAWSWTVGSAAGRWPPVCCPVDDTAAAMGGLSLSEPPLPPPPEAEAPTGMPLPPGSYVIIKSLKAKPELNGQRATVLATVAPEGRVAVRLGNGRQLAIKPENMESDNSRNE